MPVTVPLDQDGAFWLFGYGSLIHRPDVPWIARTPARLHGWSRRFWQGSHDHRGLPEAPGRVVTLIRAPDAVCAGMAYRIPSRERDQVLARLDHREKNGYEREQVRLEIGAGETLDALVYIAPPGNFAWLGPADDHAIAWQIAHAEGPSGRNRDYLLELAAALAALAAEDPHVEDLAARVRALIP
ncbi:MAG: gamma-glutamylcyclotransferase [Pseudomonadales bacterium]|jgi:cation transport protein ChaC|nr:gamma-glutamylcyclotransferase [Pseudomonadales bacterium]